MSRGSARRHSSSNRPMVWIGVASAVGLAALLAVVVVRTDTADDDGGSLQVSMIEMAFVPDDLRAHPGQEVAVSNDGAVRHSLLVVGLGKGVELAPGEAQSFTLPEDVSGAYRVICDIPGHIEAGMVATMTVSDAEVTSQTTEPVDGS